MADVERGRIRDIVGTIYASGYSAGVEQIASAYDLFHEVEGAADAMAGVLKERLSLVDKAVDGYLKLVERKAKELAEQGLDRNVQLVELTRYATNLADNKSAIISEMEYAQARLDGAGRLLDEAGQTYEWRFAHFDLGPDHEECVICEAIREKNPYTQDEAEAEGFPSYPHPGCDHGWVVVPTGEQTLTEQNA